LHDFEAKDITRREYILIKIDCKAKKEAI